MALADTARLIASLELHDKFSGPADRVIGSVDKLEGRTNRLGRIGSETSRGFGNIATNLLRVGTVAGGALAVGLGASIMAASDLNEEIDKSAVVFGKAAPLVQDFAAGAAAIGLSRAEALGAAGAFGNMFRTTGFAEGEAADMSVTMVELASDMASFNNEDPSEMLDKLRSGLSGEAEPLRRFGVLLSEATVREFAYREGIAKSGEALTESQKVQARYGLILEQTAIQQGNFADTSEGLANQQRTLRANLTNTAATIGTALLPAVAKIVGRINELFIDKAPQIAAFGERIAASLGTFLTDENLDRGMDAVSAFVDKLASGDMGGITASFSSIASGVAGLPWEAIGNAAQFLGTGSKALLDAFTSMPTWVQTAVLTGWGLNKLTGGALGSIVGELSKGLIKGVLNMNAGVVNINAKAVTGGGGGVAGPGGGIGGALAIGAGVALAGTAAAMTVDFVGDAAVMQRGINDKLDSLPRRTAAEQASSLGKIEDAIDEANRDIITSAVSNATGLNRRLDAEKREIIESQGYEARAAANTRDAIPWLQRNRQEVMNLNMSEGRRFGTLGAKVDGQKALQAAAVGKLGTIAGIEAGASGKLTGILNKKSTITVNNKVNVPIYINSMLMASRTGLAITNNGYPVGHTIL